MGRVVFAIYKPFEGKNDALIKVVKQHQPILVQEDLVTSRPFIILKAQNGCIIEVFEWRSLEAIEIAHKNENVIKLWNEFSKVCSYETLNSLEESKTIFSDFETIDLSEV